MHKSLIKQQQITIHILRTDQIEAVYDQALSWLTKERRMEALQYASAGDRLSHIAAGVLLHKCLGVTADSDLVKSAFGKPALAAGYPHFNLSHCHDTAILAIADAPVGVDIEPGHCPAAFPITARKICTDDELQWLNEDPTPERFLTLWTRKEAVLKLEGRGFLDEPRHISCLNSDPYHIQHYRLNGHIIACAMHVPFTASLNHVTLT